MSSVAKRPAEDLASAAKRGRVDGNDEFELKCINTVRVLSADIVQEANSGHPGAPMGCAPMAHVLYSNVMNYDPAHPLLPNRDRFVLSNGHGCALLYSMLHLTGYDVSMDDLKKFRKVGSITPGHPEVGVTAGVEVTTGPLGQGISNGVGMAMAEAHLAATYNKEGLNLFDHFTYVICGDGCLQEGVSSEACSLAGHLGLGKLIVLYDDNDITIDGGTNLSFTEDVVTRYTSYGWHTEVVADGTDCASILAAIERAKAATDKPSLIKVKTIIGFGSGKQGSEAVHGAPLGLEDLGKVKAKFGFDPSSKFAVSEDVSAHYRQSAAERGASVYQQWVKLLQGNNGYKEKCPDEYQTLCRLFGPEQMGESETDKTAKAEAAASTQAPAPAVPTTASNYSVIANLGSVANFPAYTPESKAEGTRKYSGAVLNALAPLMPEIVGGSADLTPSNNTQLKCSSDFQKGNYQGRYFRYGVREHGMAAISNGLFAHGGVRPFCATFLNFIGYALGSVRLSAISHFGVLYIMTHDSIGLGEDGPTHQPVEAFAMLRAMPNLHLYRPADGNEVIGAYISAMECAKTPTVLCLSRQNTPNLVGSSPFLTQRRGAYVMQEFEIGTDNKSDGTGAAVVDGSYTAGDDANIGNVFGGSGAGEVVLCLLSTGTEVATCLEVAANLAKSGLGLGLGLGKTSKGVIRVISVPCLEVFDKQDKQYKAALLPAAAVKIAVEPGATEHWFAYSNHQFGLKNRFGISGPYKDVYAALELDADSLTKKTAEVFKYFAPKGQENAMSLDVVDRPYL